MKTGFTSIALVVAMMTGTAGANDTFDERAEIEALRAEIQQLRATSDDSWLNERRTEEVKSLIRDVLSDADTRASLAEGGMTAGHNGKKFFLASEDGGFLMNIEGQIQFRWIWNNRDTEDSDDDDANETGFVLARTKLRFSGHIADPKLHYVVQIEVNRDDNDVVGDIITIGYDLTDTLTIRVGEDKAPFLHEELTSSKRQLAVERSLVNELFTMDVVQGIFLDWDATEMIHLALAISDGGRSGDDDSSPDTGSGDSVGRVDIIDIFDDFTTSPNDPGDISKEFNEDGTDIAITARADVLLSGAWGQGNDFSAGLGEEMYVRIGGAIHYEVGETGDTGSADNDNFFMWTVDGQVEYKGLSLFVAFTMAHTDFDDADSPEDYDPWGIVVQGAYNIGLDNGDSVEPFIRWERIDFDDAVSEGDTVLDSDFDDEIDLVTFGVNWYHKGHAAKFTADVVWALDPIDSDIAESNLGLIGDVDEDADDQFVVRLQYQLLF